MKGDAPLELDARGAVEQLVPISAAEADAGARRPLGVAVADEEAVRGIELRERILAVDVEQGALDAAGLVGFQL